MGSTSMEQCARSWIHKFVLVKKNGAQTCSSGFHTTIFYIYIRKVYTVKLKSMH